MFKTYFKLAYRNILKDKAYSILNISGLAIGLASSILILLWVQNEQSYDKFQKNAGQIYRIAGDFGDLKAAINTEGMPAGLKAELPVVKDYTRLSLASTVLFEAGNSKFEEKRVFYADPSFADVFSFPLVQGNRDEALKRVDGILITQEMASKYFGHENPIGKFLRKNNHENVVVTGVLASIPANSDLQFDFIMPMTPLGKVEDSTQNRWENFNYYSYIQLDRSFVPSGHNLSKLEDQMAQIFHRHISMPVVLYMQPLTKHHLA